MENLVDISGYRYLNSGLNGSHAYLLPILRSALLAEKLKAGRELRVFDLGCGNGSVTDAVAGMGFAVTGVDPSKEAIEHANAAYPHLELNQGSAYEGLAGRYGCFDIAISLEVVEHVFSPRKYAATLYSLVKDGGAAIISTPYHGYWKNLALAVSGAMDRHFTALWDFGHIKFWSIQTLTVLLKEAGFREIVFYRVGRIGPLAKSMVAVARR